MRVWKDVQVKCLTVGEELRINEKIQWLEETLPHEAMWVNLTQRPK